MMHSVALNDSHCYAAEPENDDFVIVRFDNGSVDEEFNDDDSYDYCDDAISLASASTIEDDQSSVCSETLLTFNQEAVKFSESPSMMKFLDEAHEAAKLATTAEDKTDEQDEDGKNYSNCSGDGRTHTQSLSDNKTNNVVAADTSNVSRSNMKEEKSTKARAEKKDSEVTTSTTNQSSDSFGNTESSAAATSRLSNKKRRKKMKLMKKASAAAAAAATLSHMRISPCAESAEKSSNNATNSSPKKKLSPMKKPSRCHSKRVANIAVACATESICSYKEAVLSTKNKKLC